MKKYSPFMGAILAIQSSILAILPALETFLTFLNLVIGTAIGVIGLLTAYTKYKALQDPEKGKG